MNPEINNNIYLEHYKQRSVFDSNCVEFWGCVDDRIIPNICPNRYYVSTFGRTYNVNTCRPFGLSMHRKGYYQYNFATTEHKGVTRKLHRVIMFTFCYFPGCENYEINHIDGNKLNNAITNLEWCTSSENTIHAINLGIKTVFGNESAKVTLQNDDSVEEILYLYYCENYTPSEIVQIMRNNYNIEVGSALVNNICHGNSRLSYFNDRYGERSSTSGNTYSFKDYLIYKHNIRFANSNDFI